MVSIPWLDSLKYKAGIFDLRGTLLDLDPRYKEVLYLRIIREFGKRTGNSYLSTFTEADLAQLLRMSTAKRAEALERFGLDREAFNEAWVTDKALSIRMRYTRVHPDARALQVLKAKGVKLAVVTLAAKRAADMDIGIIKGKIGSRVFDEVVIASSQPGVAPKPDPAAIKLCLEGMSVLPQEAFGVGNSDRDICAYKAAGVFDILIRRPGSSGTRYAAGKVKPSMEITSLEELIPLAIRRGILSRLLCRRLAPPTAWP